MWLFQKKKISLGELCNGFTDYHSHILPGVDDGVQTIEESLAVLQLYEKCGVKSVWLTPHIMEEIPNTTAHIEERFALLQSLYSGSIQLYVAAEYMLDSLFEERLANNDLLPLTDSKNHLLVETSYFNPPIDLHNTLLRIKAKGYYPVLAHPERYIYMDKSDYKHLKEIGVKFQLNIPSLVGFYGSKAAKKAEWLSKNNFYDFYGTDTHHLSIIEQLTKAKCKKLVNGLNA